MVIDINKKTIDQIVNEDFKADAMRYISIYDEFIAEVLATGIEIDDATTDDSVADYSKLVEDTSGITISNHGLSIHYGEVSPACINCRTGEDSLTVFHSLKCNRDCFFCANMNQSDYEYYVDNINDAFAEVEAADMGNGFKSLALTGGEPLLMPDRAIEFFQKCKEKYPNAHLRLYTNGDLLDPMLATKLTNAGLDEVRISVKLEGDYYPEKTIEIIRSVSGIIPTVMVEMPVMPGTLETMKRLFLDLEDAGTDAINILEFLFPWVNASKYKNRGFKVRLRPYKVLYDYRYAGGLPIAGSAEECIELVKFAASKKLNMRVHFCSLENKLTSQLYMQNSGIDLMPYEVMSEKDFFIKTARVYGRNALKAEKYLSKKGANFRKTGMRVDFHPQYIKEIEGLSEAGLTYNVVESRGTSLVMRELKIDLIKPELFDYEKDI